jgi:hypothetical protein
LIWEVLFTIIKKKGNKINDEGCTYLKENLMGHEKIEHFNVYSTSFKIKNRQQHFRKRVKRIM